METASLNTKPQKLSQEPEALAAAVATRIALGVRVGQTFSQMYRLAVKGVAERYGVSEESVEDAYIAEGLAKLTRDAEPAIEEVLDVA